MNKKIVVPLALAVALLTVTVASSEDLETLRHGGQPAVNDLHERLLRGEVDEAMLDRTCAQKDCASSRLYWFTDLEEAKDAARRTGRPIVALFMLGRLDEELSCANSRFFRTMLYSDDAISSQLREGFVVYWQSVRPVPVVTIDLGDGRTIRQTITGNSVHYLLSEEGRVLDALPGLYSPAAFGGQLREWLFLHRAWQTRDAEEREPFLRLYHEERLEQSGAAGMRAEETATAEHAAAIAATKAVLEVPVLRVLQPGADRRLAERGSLVAVSDEEIRDVVFSSASLALMRKKQPIDEALLRRLRLSVAEDTDFNAGTLHPRIHVWFAGGEATSLESLNERIYRELFLAPTDDPWMGLKPPSAFAALAE